MAKASGKRPKRKKIRPAVPPPAGKPETQAAAPAISLRNVVLLTLGSGILLFLIGSGWLLIRGRDADRTYQSHASVFVGSEKCADCHPSEARLWRGSQHKAAMDHATTQSVRGDFSGVSFEYHGTRSRFFRSGEKFLVETDGADGKPATFEVKYTFGVDPLQQYLVEFPDGRVQALSVAWDTRPKEQGGQRWFHLYPDTAVTHLDPLHWTKLHQNWNFMCAECHSTGVRRNYDAAADRFATSFAEISVGCEACHGAGSRHVAWAQGGRRGDPGKGLAVNFDERAGVSWNSDPSGPLPRRSAPAAPLRKEVETCGLCHARRGQLAEDWKPGQWLSQTHRVTLLDRRLFHADGQMRDDEETYNYAPFKMSRMFAAGVTCSDCHDPHSGKLKAAFDATCGQCHVPAKYETAAHRRHEGVGLTCASCHMPVRKYMVVDRRHDHGFRIPRPDLSVQTGAPNACNDCHIDKPAKWAAQHIENWFGPERHGHQIYAPAFHAAWSASVDATAMLATVAGSGDAPSIVRASALAELPAPDLNLIRRGLSDSDPLVRLGALDAMEVVPADQLWTLASAQLADPVRGVRIRAAEILASVPAVQQPAADRDKFAQAAAEFAAAQRLNADRPEARTALGGFLARRADTSGAEAEYKAAIKLDPSFAPAAINLSDLYRQLARDGDGERVLRRALSSSTQNASLHHALGLALVRQKRGEAALEELRQAAVLDPGQPRYAYVYAVALNSAGRRDEALAVLKGGLRGHPNNLDLLSAAITFSREKGDVVAALEYADRLARLLPDDSRLADLIRELRR